MRGAKKLSKFGKLSNQGLSVGYWVLLYGQYIQTNTANLWRKAHTSKQIEEGVVHSYDQKFGQKFNIW